MEGLGLKVQEDFGLNFWAGKRVFVTGHTGFKGSWLSLILQSYGASVCGYSLEPASAQSLFRVASIADGMDSVISDIRDLEKLKDTLNQFQADVVIHMAAQPLVRFSYRNPVDTYSTNVLGTVNLLEAVRNCASVKAVVNVTTDKCYENKERLWGYRENEPMGGHDPYSSSKGCSELVTAAYRASFFNTPAAASVATARAGNVIGGGDWSEDRLIPDLIKHFENNQPVMIRSPNAIRPWQHVLEPLYGYLMLAERLCTEGHVFSQAWNFGPSDDDVRPVAAVVEYMANKWGNGVAWNVDRTDQLHEAQLLRLDTSKAKHVLGWVPKWDLGIALDSIVEWHKKFTAGEDMRAVTLAQMSQYEKTRAKVYE
jgi:CDP-glucose 4,6-dehydratase